MTIPTPKVKLVDTKALCTTSWYEWFRQIISFGKNINGPATLTFGNSLANMFSTNDVTSINLALKSDDPGGHSGQIHSTLTVSSSPAGSGAFGPASTDVGAVISVIKDGFPTNASSTSGEMDALYLVGRQSGNGDVSSDLAGWLVNVVNVEGCGFIAASEGVISTIDQSTFLPIQGLSYSLCNINSYPPAVLDNGTVGFGLILNAEYGANATGLYIRDVPGTGGTWNTAIEVEQSNATVFQISSGGNFWALMNNAIPAGGLADVGLKMSATSHFGIFFGSSTPTLSAAKGSLYLRSDGTTTNNRMYVNTDGGTTWTAVVTVA